MIERSKKLWAIALCAMLSLSAFAQNDNPSNNGNSPYSRYGYGRMAETAFVRNRGMGGISQGLRSNLQTNAANPASYTAIDSMTFLFDFGLNLELSNYKENGLSQRDWNGGIEYISMQVPIGRYFAANLGMSPYTYVGYEYGTSDSIQTGATESDQTYFVSRYNGTGGLNKVYLGFAAEPFKWMSLGVNVGYIFGDITNNINVEFSNSTISPTRVMQEISARALELQFGLQLTHTFAEKHNVTLGATFTPKMNLWADSDLYRSTTAVDTITNNQVLSIPQAFGVGMTYVYDKRVTIGADYKQTDWGDVDGFDENLQVASNLFKNMKTIAVGAEYLPSLTSRNYLKRMRYRLGMNYTDSYVQVKGSQNREMSLSLGLGLPLKSQKSMVNVSFEYTDLKPQNSDFLSEAYFQLNLGLTFNEFWFFKNRLK